MKEKKRDQEFIKDESRDHLYGLSDEDSLQSVNFATTENVYLNEHYQEEADE